MRAGSKTPSKFPRFVGRCRFLVMIPRHRLPLGRKLSEKQGETSLDVRSE